MTTPEVTIVMLTDTQLAEEIDAVADETCCPTYSAAAAAMCGCGGRAQAWMDRLMAEAERRDGGRL